jgi:hypothetical protein
MHDIPREMLVPIGNLASYVTATLPAWISTLAQIGLDPTPFTAWGVLGLLGVMLIVLAGILWKLFSRQTAFMEQNTKTLIDFVNDHRGETATALEKITGAISASHDRMTDAFVKQARVLDEVLLMSRIFEQVKRAKLEGVNLDDTLVERIVRTVTQERSSRRGE